MAEHKGALVPQESASAGDQRHKATGCFFPAQSRHEQRRDDPWNRAKLRYIFETPFILVLLEVCVLFICGQLQDVTTCPKSTRASQRSRTRDDLLET